MRILLLFLFLTVLASAQDITYRYGIGLKWQDSDRTHTAGIGFATGNQTSNSMLLFPRTHSLGYLYNDGAGNTSWQAGGASAALVNGRVGYGNASNILTGETGFEYNAASNTLSVENYRIGSNGILLSTPAADHIALTADGTGDDLIIDLDTDNAARVYSLAGVSSLTFAGIDLIVPTEVYDATSWNGDFSVPTKDAVRDKIESVLAGGASLTSTLVGYGDGSNVLTGEAGFEYNPTTNVLSVPGLAVSGTQTVGILAAGLITLNDTGSDHSMSMLVGENLTVNRSLTWILGDASRTLTVPGTMTLAGANYANSWADDIRQTFNPGATVAGLNVGQHAGNPSTLVNGDIYYDATANTLKARINGATQELGNVQAASAYGNDNRLVRTDGTGRGTQATGITVDDDDDVSGVNLFTASEVTASTKFTAGGAYVDTPNAMGALVVNLNRTLNTKTANGNQTITLSGGTTEGNLSSLRWTNTALTTATISWAVDVYDANSGVLVTNFTVPASDGTTHGRRHVAFGYDGSDYLIYQGGGDGGGVADEVDWPDITNIPTNVEQLGDAVDPGEDALWWWDDTNGIWATLPLHTSLDIVAGELRATEPIQAGDYIGSGAYDPGFIYSGDLDGDDAITLTFTEGQRSSFLLNVDGSPTPRTFSFTSAYRVGASGGPITSFVFSNDGIATLDFYKDGANLYVSIFVYERVSLTADVTGTLPVANGGTGVTTSTGSGNVVLSTSPTLTTPNLGTPSAATLTNATGLPVSTGVSGLGTGVATFLGTPSSANLATALTDETGSGGGFVRATSPTLTTPNLGTPSAATLTNATGLPISTGVSGLGANVATALATPSSANLRSAVTDEVGTGSLMFTRTGVLRTFYVAAAAMTPRTTNGPARGTVETGTNDIMFETLDFDQTTEEGAGFWMTMPATWNGGTVTAKFQWTASGGSAAETVAWNIAARGFADDAAIDQALGTEQAASDALIATADMHISATTPAITIGGTAAAGTPTYFQVTRDVGTDNLAADARLLGVTIEYTESATEPSAQ